MNVDERIIKQWEDRCYKDAIKTAMTSRGATKEEFDIFESLGDDVDKVCTLIAKYFGMTNVDKEDSTIGYSVVERRKNAHQTKIVIREQNIHNAHILKTMRLSNAEIAKALRYSESYILYLLKQDDPSDDFYTNRERRAYYVEAKKKIRIARLFAIKSLRNEGLTISDIAKKMKLNESTVLSLFKKGDELE